MYTIKKVILYSLLIASIIITGSLTLSAQSDNSNLWEKVESYVKKGQPRSALKIVDQIYNQSKEADDTPQVVKSLIYRISLQSKYEENHLIVSINELQTKITDANSPEKQLLQSLVAELYQAYLNKNRWIIANRLVVADDSNTDISTWDAIRFNKEISKYYSSSLENKKELSQIRLSDYFTILQDGDSSNTTLFPYLYDLLANRAINYYSTDDFSMLSIGSPAEQSITKYIVSTSDFINMKINPKVSTNNMVLSLFHGLIILHSNNNNTEALVDLELRRLNFCFNNSNQSSESKEALIGSLTLLAKKYRNNPVYASVAYELANRYYTDASNYSPGFSEDSKLYYVIADSICNTVITDYTNVDGSNKCRNLSERINTKNLNFEIPVAQLPGKPTLSLVEFKNISKLYFKIVEGDAMANADRHNLKEYIQRELRKEEVLSWTQELPTTFDARLHTVEMKIPELTMGYYIIFASDDPSFSTTQTIKYKPLWITNISYITNGNSNASYTDLYTIDRETGKSIGEVNITIYQQQYENRSRSYNINKIGNLKTDKYGYAKIESIGGSSYGTYLFEFEKDGNSLFSENYLNFFKAPVNEKPKVKTTIFTDRAVYRPGQTVYFKGIVTKELVGNVSLVANASAEVEFINASRKKLNTSNLTTNENGSFNGFFTIPVDGMNGNMTIKTKTGSIQFLVENYKLPTFEVVFDTLAGQPKLGNKVSVVGNAKGFAGNAIDGAKVTYRIIRKVYFPIPYYRNYERWIPPHGNQDIEVAHGSMNTNTEGSFTIIFDALADKSIPTKTFPTYTYNISAEVSDITGEVHVGETSISVGEKTVNLNIEMAESIDLNNISNIAITAKNLNGSSLNFKTSVEIFKLTPPERLLVNRQWPTPEYNTIPEVEFKADFPHEAYKNENNPHNWQKLLITTKDFAFDGNLLLPKNIFTDFEPGEYMISAKGVDNYGTTIETNHVFTLYSSTSKKMPGNKINWAIITDNHAEPKDIIKLVVGSSTKKSQIVYEITVGKEIIDRKWISLNKGQKIIEIPVIEAYRGNFSINVGMVKFNRFYSENFNITVPFTNKELDISMHTSRNYLTPGQKEEWKVTISGKDGQKLAAHLLAGMYDASLDVFKTSSWEMNLYKNNRYNNKWESNQFAASWSSALFVPETKYYQISATNYPVINWFGYYPSGYNPIAYNQSDFLYRKSIVAEATMSGFVEEDSQMAMLDKESEIITPPEQEQESTQQLIPLRTNFNETAFFYPELHTDESGNVSFSFNTPDALTEWKIRMLAYTNDLKVGTLEQEIQSQKELMIIPNVPRFVRHGDTLVFTAKVINFTDKQIDATSEIEFFDAVTMKPVTLFVGNTESSTSNKIGAKQSAAISWTISIPDNLNMLAYRIRSTTDNFSDGEERMFPVLTNRMLVTNSLPMNVSAKSTTSFDFESLTNYDENSTIKNHKYIVEFTSNPSWYAVQALPYLSTPENKNNIALFNTYFANTLSSYIVNSNPNIKSVFRSWQNITPDAFLSNLQKNPELKSAVLNATPWVLEAEDEAEQKRRIGILFDVTRMSKQKEAIFNKLAEGQLSSGAWPWFKGMKEDRHTTQSIVLGMAKLHHKGVLDLKSNNKRFQMFRKAVRWLDNEILADYKDLKKHKAKSMKSYEIRSSQTQYLYLRALLMDIIPVDDKYQVAINYYTNQAKKYWLKQSNYLQGMTAIFLHDFGHRNESEAIIRSLKERSLYSKEMGMYWRQEKGWNWYQAPVETQAMMIETMAELNNNPTIIEQLKIWLIKQKQTQNWKTSSATAEAVFALLMYGNNTLEQSEQVKITVGDNVISENKDITKEAGTGYFSTSWSGTEITPELSHITIENPNNNIAWGAAYWQFFEDMDKIESHNSPLSITKNLFIESMSDNGPELVAIEDINGLKTGDKVVVRLIISSDRNMEYVHLKDMRATAFEPVNPISGYTYSGGLWYYKNITDVSTDFFMRYLHKGTYVLEYSLFVTQKGEFTNGIATIQSMYAPEFGAHSEGIRISVGE